MLLSLSISPSLSLSLSLSFHSVQSSCYYGSTHPIVDMEEYSRVSAGTIVICTKSSGTLRTRSVLADRNDIPLYLLHYPCYDAHHIRADTNLIVHAC
jgi:hypothetical protein